MKLSAPLYHLKRKAKLLSRAENIPLHEALNRVPELGSVVVETLTAPRPRVVPSDAEAGNARQTLRPGGPEIDLDAGGRQGARQLIHVVLGSADEVSAEPMQHVVEHFVRQHHAAASLEHQAVGV